MHPHPRQNTIFTGFSGGFEALLVSSHRFSFNGQERDDEISGEGNSLCFKYRVEDSRLGRFFSVDPLFRHYSYNSTYAFAENRVIDGRELEGLEVVLINEGKDEELYKVAKSNIDDSAVHIYAQGTPSHMDLTGTGKWSDKVEDFRPILEKSTVYQTRSSKEKIVIILHSCRIGRSFYDENGTYVPSYAERLSKEYPEFIFIAPDERVGFGNNKEIGPVEIDNPKNQRGDFRGREPEFSNRYGNWNVFVNGELLGCYNGADYDGQKQPTIIERLFYFRPNSHQSTQQNSNSDKSAEKNQNFIEKK